MYNTLYPQPKTLKRRGAVFVDKFLRRMALSICLLIAVYLICTIDICTYTYTYTNTYICKYIYTYVCIHIYTNIYICKYVYTYVFICIDIHINIKVPCILTPNPYGRGAVFVDKFLRRMALFVCLLIAVYPHAYMIKPVCCTQIPVPIALYPVP